MKTNKFILLAVSLAFAFVLLTGCSGTKSIQGTWKVQDGSGANSTITFTDKMVTVEGQNFDYTQNEAGTKNGINYYGIKQNNQNYTIIFPEKKDKNVAIMIKPDSIDEPLQGTLIHAMDKSKQPNYAEYAAKYSN
ncbi:glycosyltransferase [Lactovum odontotermitis]